LKANRQVDHHARKLPVKIFDSGILVSENFVKAIVD